jgi:hypothetical protein
MRKPNVQGVEHAIPQFAAVEMFETRKAMRR